MKISITNKVGKPAKKHLETFKSRFPQFKFCNDITYNGQTVEIDDDDKDDFLEALEAAGYDCETDDDAEDAQESNVPKMPKTKPKLSRASPKLPKSKPVLGKVRPTLPKR